ncbi:unnamed protein product [Callosobruchus maculatus]|uniref:Flavin-containing monooxygenase n=1 Tax=Callosobruchus maculatus TaxID=64391 RepID=A0A653C267_CALMS|nr:unnamed protein product [Callosobruchus maculatus]
MKRVAVVGAGAAGLCAARHVKDLGYHCDVIEMNEQIGGTWYYTDEVGTDRYGYPVYSAMYKGLKTNLPKEAMGYPDFPIPEREKSYLTQAEILDFLNLYADNFNLRPLIKFNCMVTDIRPMEDNTWQVTFVHKPTKEEASDIYDAVMICNGHYNEPSYVDYEGQENFRGTIEHSHSFRSPEPYEGKRVLIVGSGPSGLDLTLQISRVAKYVALSHHSPEIVNSQYPDHVIQKPDVKRVVDGEQVEFVDGTCCGFDVILLCTGYKYSFPFLHESCGITNEENCIAPLYKHLIHLERPTMCFIGIPFEVCAFQMFDLQARYFCKFLEGSMQLPSTEEMRAHTEAELKWRLEKGYTKRRFHRMGPYQEMYYNDLSTEANIKPIAPVIVKLREESGKRLASDFLNFRNDRYKIIDDENFVMEKMHS